jgi:hypothetical protein
MNSKHLLLSILLLFYHCNVPEESFNNTPITSNEELQNHLLKGWNTWNKDIFNMYVLLIVFNENY